MFANEASKNESYLTYESSQEFVFWKCNIQDTGIFIQDNNMHTNCAQISFHHI